MENVASMVGIEREFFLLTMALKASPQGELEVDRWSWVDPSYGLGARTARAINRSHHGPQNDAGRALTTRELRTTPIWVDRG